MSAETSPYVGMDGERYVLLTIHGAWSDNSGLEQLVKFCEKEISGLKTYRINYGDTPGHSLLSRRNRKYLKASVQNEFFKFRELLFDGTGKNFPRGRNSVIVAVAHSFGTYLLLSYLQRPVNDLRISKIVLLSSVLSRWTDWDHIIDSIGSLIQTPVNLVRPFDFGVFLGEFVGGGRSGTRGFSPSGTRAPVDHFKHGGHTSYCQEDFEDIKNIILGRFDISIVIDSKKFFSNLRWYKRATLRLLRFFQIL